MMISKFSTMFDRGSGERPKKRLLCLSAFLMLLPASSLLMAAPLKLPSSGEKKVKGPDGQLYTISRSFAADEYAPMVVIVINKPVALAELPAASIDRFFTKLLIEECALIEGKPSFKHVQNPDFMVSRYVWRGRKRVAWQTTAHCVRK